MEGQTLIAEMEGVMKDNGIEFSACWKLMSCGGEITKYMTEFLQSIPEGQKKCSDKEIGELFGVYSWLLGHLEAFFSIFCKKWFHLNYSDLDKAMLHRAAINNLWRYLKTSVTPKLHILFVYLL